MMRLTVFLCAICFSFVAQAAPQTKIIKVYVTNGTGFFVSHDGYLLTNQHVVRDCKRITIAGAVPLQEVKLISADEKHDLALLKANATPPDIATLRGTAFPLAKDERVIVIGYPGDAFKSGKPVTREAAVVSPAGPMGEEEWLQLSDVAMQGDSGGPLLDAAGNVVGVTSAQVGVYNLFDNLRQGGTLRRVSVAVSLSSLRDFLSRANVGYRESNASVTFSASRLTDDARDFLINVQCEYKREVE